MEDAIWPVIKWVLIIMLAGFIGQFGKILADEIVARTRSKEKEDSSSDISPALPPVDTGTNAPPEPAVKPPTLSDKASVKLDKKAVKAKAKQMKKAARD